MPTNLQTHITQLSSDDANAQAAAAEAIARLGTGAQPAAVALVEACGSADDAVREWCVAALEELGPPATAQIPRLTELARDARLDVAYWAITLLGRAGEAAAPAVPALADVLRDGEDTAVRERAAWALGKLGPAAADEAAVAALRDAAASDQPRLARLAKGALEATADDG